MMDRNRPLSLKQSLFIEHYLGDCAGNGTEAARRSGYAGNDVTLQAVASENLAKPQIARRVRARVEELGITTDALLTELAAIAFSEWQEHVTIQVRAGAAVAVKMDLKDKVRALELLMKHKGLLNGKVTIGGGMRHDHGITPAVAITLLAMLEPSEPPSR